ncbi:MAG: hypothetical protein FJ137_18035 [Deltaproteobacteria bacterium]|nr:hypothetical protein [Deltaproteobacteria bacterium]
MRSGAGYLFFSVDQQAAHPGSARRSRCQSSAVSRQSSVVSRQSSAVSRQPSVVSRQSSAVSRQSSVVSRQSSVVSRPSWPAGTAADVAGGGLWAWWNLLMLKRSIHT